MRNAARVKQIFTERAVPWRVRDIFVKECWARLLDPADVLGPGRAQVLAQCREALYHTLRAEKRADGRAKHNYETIGRWFGRHSTTLFNVCNAAAREARRKRNRAKYLARKGKVTGLQ